MRKAPNKIEFTADEHRFLLENYSEMTAQQMADALGKKRTRVRMELYSLGIKKIEMVYWTPEQVQYLKENYRTKGDTEITAYFKEKFEKEKGWSKKHIEKKRRYLNLKRTVAEIKAIHHRNVEMGRFSICPVKAWDTRGRPEIGDIQIWKKNGYMCKVIRLENGYIPLSHYVWINAGNHLLKGYAVVHKDGNQLNCLLENLEQITLAENARRNHDKYLNYPDDLKEVIHLTNLLTRKINKKKQQHGKK